MSPYSNKGFVAYIPFIMLAEEANFRIGNFLYKNNEITVYVGALSAIPVGENSEAMEEHILQIPEPGSQKLSNRIKVDYY